MLRLLTSLALMAVLSACMGTAPTPAPQPRPALAPSLPPDQAAQQFIRVVQQVEPVAEAECRLRLPSANCDFKIVVDDRPGQPPNAFQTLDAQGRPVLAFNLGLIATVQNADELAFVMGHEAAHHIAGHLARQREAATAGAVIFAGLASLTGADFERYPLGPRAGGHGGRAHLFQGFRARGRCAGHGHFHARRV